MSKFNKRELSIELKSARMLKSEDTPGNVISENFSIEIKDIQSG